MHKGCSGTFDTGKQVVDKIRMMGFNRISLESPFEIWCSNCDTVFQMTTMETHCPCCSMVYGVTPCHSHSAEFVKPEGVKY